MRTSLNRNYHSARRDLRAVLWEVNALTEIVASFARVYYNHTPPIDEAAKTQAVRSGKMRFETFVQKIVDNLRNKESVLGAADLSAPADPVASVPETAEKSNE